MHILVCYNPIQYKSYDGKRMSPSFTYVQPTMVYSYYRLWYFDVTFIKKKNLPFCFCRYEKQLRVSRMHRRSSSQCNRRLLESIGKSSQGKAIIFYYFVYQSIFVFYLLLGSFFLSLSFIYWLCVGPLARRVRVRVATFTSTYEMSKGYPFSIIRRVYNM